MCIRDSIYTAVVPDDPDRIQNALVHCADILRADLILTTGGTGLSPRDVTPEATRTVVDREIPAIPQAMLFASLQITPRAMLSRAAAGTRGQSLIVNLPGSEKAARENLEAVLHTLGHALEMIRMCIRDRAYSVSHRWANSWRVVFSPARTCPFFTRCSKAKAKACTAFSSFLGERLGSGVKVAVWRSFLPRMS